MSNDTQRVSRLREELAGVSGRVFHGGLVEDAGGDIRIRIS